MARKYVRFNYFEVKLVPAKEAFKKQIAEVDQEDITFSSADLWDMTEFLNFLDSNKETFDETNAENLNLVLSFTPRNIRPMVFNFPNWSIRISHPRRKSGRLKKK